MLGGLAFGLTLAQVAVYIVDSRWHGLDDLGRFRGEWEHRGTAGLLACAVLALALAGAAAYQRRSGQLDWFAAALASVSLPFALLSVWALVHGTDGRGTALLMLTAVYAASAVASRLPGEARHFADLPVALSLFAVALATATYLSKGGLLTAWTLEGLALTALAVRSGRKGYQAAGLAYFAAAGAHLFAFEVPLTHLFLQRLHPAQHIVELLLMVASLAVAALLLRGRELLFPRLDLAAAATAGLLGLYAASLGMLQASQELGAPTCMRASSAVRRSSPRLGALAALGLLSAGLARRGKELRRCGLALLGLALAKLFLFDLSQLSSLTRAGSFLAVGLALLAGGLLVQRLSRNGRPPGPVAGQL